MIDKIMNFFGVGNGKESSGSYRKYHEVFGDALNELKFYRTLILCLVALSIYLTITTFSLLKKPPLVIRVDNLGQATAIKEYQDQINVSKEEVSNFTQYFLQYYTTWNFYSYDDDFTRAFQMMTKECQQKLNEFLNANGIPETIKQEQLKTKLNITEITIEKDTNAFVNLRVRGNRVVSSYKPDVPSREIIFENLLTLKKVERSEKSPWGLLVDNWSESVFK